MNVCGITDTSSIYGLCPVFSLSAQLLICFWLLPPFKIVSTSTPLIPPLINVCQEIRRRAGELLNLKQKSVNNGEMRVFEVNLNNVYFSCMQHCFEAHDVDCFLQCTVHIVECSAHIVKCSVHIFRASASRARLRIFIAGQRVSRLRIPSIQVSQVSSPGNCCSINKQVDPIQSHPKESASSASQVSSTGNAELLLYDSTGVFSGSL